MPAGCPVGRVVAHQLADRMAVKGKRVAFVLQVHAGLGVVAGVVDGRRARDLLGCRAVVDAAGDTGDEPLRIFRHFVQVVFENAIVVMLPMSLRR